MWGRGGWIKCGWGRGWREVRCRGPEWWTGIKILSLSLLWMDKWAGARKEREASQILASCLAFSFFHFHQ